MSDTTDITDTTDTTADLTADLEALDDAAVDTAPLDTAPVDTVPVETEPNGASGEVEVSCPGCGLTLVGESPRPSAEWFCPRCDYPLFWASEPDPEARPASRAARRRLPGTGGRTRAGAEPCWHCGEMGEPGDAECRRCAARLPKPLAPTVEVERPFPVPVPVLVRATTWPFVAAGSCAGGAIAIAVTLWITGGGA